MGLLSILRVADRGPVARRHRRTFTPGLELGLRVENLESRVVLSHAAPAVAPLPNNIDVGEILGSAIDFSDITITDVQLEGLELVDGVVTATGGFVTGTVAGLPFTADITNFALELIPDAESGEACSILDLELGPIDIDLLGLHVDTSPICLSVTAFQGEGLLGDLLCGIAGGDLPLGDLTGGLEQLLNAAFADAQPGQGGGGGGGEVEDICDGECEILDLTLGPVDLDLLGVNIHLDNCEGGPVQVCVSASRGEGLLGNLLCGLTNPNGNRFGLARRLESLLDQLFGQLA
jgi:hypothetical protein